MEESLPPGYSPEHIKYCLSSSHVVKMLMPCVVEYHYIRRPGNACLERVLRLVLFLNLGIFVHDNCVKLCLKPCTVITAINIAETIVRSFPSVNLIPWTKLRASLE